MEHKTWFSTKKSSTGKLKITDTQLAALKVTYRKYLKNTEIIPTPPPNVIYEGKQNKTSRSDGQIIAVPDGDECKQMAKKS